jgi:hypothetical protein
MLPPVIFPPIVVFSWAKTGVTEARLSDKGGLDLYDDDMGESKGKEDVYRG